MPNIEVENGIKCHEEKYLNCQSSKMKKKMWVKPIFTEIMRNIQGYNLLVETEGP